MEEQGLSGAEREGGLKGLRGQAGRGGQVGRTLGEKCGGGAHEAQERQLPQRFGEASPLASSLQGRPVFCTFPSLHYLARVAQVTPQEALSGVAEPV